MDRHGLVLELAMVQLTAPVRVFVEYLARNKKASEISGQLTHI